jgi:hypothetical protein
MILLVVVGLLIGACSSGEATSPTDATAEATATVDPATTKAPPVASSSPIVGSDGVEFDPPPEYETGPTDPRLLAALDALFLDASTSAITAADVAAVADVGDVRAAWYLADLMRFISQGAVADALVAAFTELTGVQITSNPFGSPWGEVTDRLIAWDIPAFDEYREYKADVFGLVDPRWSVIFEDPEADIDWRHLSWGGVFIDDRPLNDPAGCPNGCIPALDDPAVTDAGGGDWYPDERIVFGVVVNDEARAYPKNIMEVHEMVNDTVGGRRIGMPYCTLCGSAQAYLTDSVPPGIAVPVLRTSGLLIRSNKVTYDLLSGSVFDTFTGKAASGSLREQGVALQQITVVTSTWGSWKQAYPDTTIVAQDGGVGRVYADDPLGGRDDNGPIFPIGDVDPRYPPHTPVIGVIDSAGSPVAFTVGEAELAMRGGDPVTLGDVTLRSDGSGFRAFSGDGTELAAHQAFWFAWTQFHPSTAVWPNDA